MYVQDGNFISPQDATASRNTEWQNTEFDVHLTVYRDIFL
jgi:hypothetical protein